MCDFFDNYDGEFIEDDFDDDMEGSADADINDDQNQEDDQNDGFDVKDAFFTGGLFGFAYEEGERERRKRRNSGSDDPSNID